MRKKAYMEIQKSKFDKYLADVKVGKLRGNFKIKMKNCNENPTFLE